MQSQKHNTRVSPKILSCMSNKLGEGGDALQAHKINTWIIDLSLRVSSKLWEGETRGGACSSLFLVLECEREESILFWERGKGKGMLLSCPSGWPDPAAPAQPSSTALVRLAPNGTVWNDSFLSPQRQRAKEWKWWTESGAQAARAVRINEISRKLPQSSQPRIWT
jgi:hypothetical protein